MFIDIWRKYVMHIFHQETKYKEKYTKIIKESVENILVKDEEAEFNKQINFQDIQKKRKIYVTEKYLYIGVNLLKITFLDGTRNILV